MELKNFKDFASAFLKLISSDGYYYYLVEGSASKVTARQPKFIELEKPMPVPFTRWWTSYCITEELSGIFHIVSVHQLYKVSSVLPLSSIQTTSNLETVNK